MDLYRKAAFALLTAALGVAAVTQDSHEARVRAALKDTAADFWIYEDLERGYTAAQEGDKPLLVSFRCVP